MEKKKNIKKHASEHSNMKTDKSKVHYTEVEEPILAPFSISSTAIRNNGNVQSDLNNVGIHVTEDVLSRLRKLGLDRSLAG